jgi:hypothetical protein
MPDSNHEFSIRGFGADAHGDLSNFLRVEIVNALKPLRR